MAAKGIVVRGFLRNLRAALDARYEREIDYLRDRHPWMADYDIEPPVKGWHAVHKPTGIRVGPAKNITALDALILADHQSRPLRPRPVPLPLRERGEDDGVTQIDIPAWTPRHRGGAA